MRRKHLLLLLLSGLSISALSQQKPASNTAQPAVYELDEAVRQKLVSVEIKGTGGHQGTCLKVVCKNLKGKFLRLRIPQGQFMDPVDSTFQTLVVAEELTLAVTAKTPVEALVKTFCAQSGDRSPLSGSVFAVGAMAPEHLRKLLKYITDSGKTDLPEAQNAVWCVTNDGSLGSIGDGELTKFTAELLKKPVPGYKIKYETVQQVPGSRAELGKALVVEGNFRYYLEKDEKITMNLLDAEGKKLHQISKEELMKAGEHRTGFTLQVWNLDPGNYIVRIQTKAGRTIKDIEVVF